MMSEPTTAGTVALVADAERVQLWPVIIIDEIEEGLLVVPTSGDVNMAAEWDVLLRREVLGYAAHAETWNYGVVLPEQVDDVVTTVPEAALRQVSETIRAHRLGKPAPFTVALGPPILDVMDPRLMFQEVEIEAVRPMWSPALMLAGAATIGQLAQHRAGDLAMVEAAAPGLADLAADDLYLPMRFSAAELGALLRRLRLLPSQRLAALLRVTLEQAVPALPRGVGPRAAVEHDKYVREVMLAMTEGTG
jgi:hypothetical protein